MRACACLACALLRVPPSYGRVLATAVELQPSAPPSQFPPAPAVLPCPTGCKATKCANRVCTACREGWMQRGTTCTRGKGYQIVGSAELKRCTTLEHAMMEGWRAAQTHTVPSIAALALAHIRWMGPERMVPRSFASVPTRHSCGYVHMHARHCTHTQNPSAPAALQRPPALGGPSGHCTAQCAPQILTRAARNAQSTTLRSMASARGAPRVQAGGRGGVTCAATLPPLASPAPNVCMWTH